MTPLGAVRQEAPSRAWWGVLGLFLLGISISSALQAQRWRELQDDERARLALQVKTIEQIASQQIRAVHRAMLGLRDELDGWPPSGVMQIGSARLKAMTDATPGLRTTALLDERGQVLASNRPELIGRKVAEEARAPTGAHVDTLYVSPPFRIRQGAVSINFTIVAPATAARPMRTIAIMLDPDYFKVVLSAVLYAPDMSAMVVHDNGGLLVVEPEWRDAPEVNLAQQGSLFSGYAEYRGKPVPALPVFVGRSPIDGSERMVAWSRLQPDGVPMDLPLVLMVSRDLGTVFAPWWFRMKWIVVFYLVLAAALVCGLILRARSRRVDQARRRSEAERLELALQGAELGMWDLDLEGWQISLDARCAAMLGRAADAAVVAHAQWLTLIHPDDLPGTAAAFEAHVDGSTPRFETQYRIRHADGAWRWLLARGQVLVRSPNGKPLHMLGTHMDCTERRLSEEAQLTLQAQLTAAQKMEALGTFSCGVAHDFNNIVAAILGNAVLAEQDVGTDHPVRSSLMKIRQAGLRARGMVEQILAFGRQQPGTMGAQPLAAAVEETVALMRAGLPERVELRTQLSKEPIHARADPTQLQQVLMNLVTNAWHALPETGGVIEMGLRHLGPGSALVPSGTGLADRALAHLWVSDNGSGMDSATRLRIFDPFFTTKPAGRGTGLGLAVVHGIVRSHGGAIAVDSTPGLGSTFHLYFPTTEPPTGPASGEARQVVLTKRSASPEVLYVDDDEVMIVLAEQLLLRADCRVSTCQQAGQALTLVAERRQHFDVVVTDNNMPGLSGLELATQILALQPGLLVILISGLVSDDLRGQAQARGVHMVLDKAKSIETLPESILHALERHRQAA